MKKILGFILILVVGAVLGGLFGRGGAFIVRSEPHTPLERIRNDYAEAVKIVTENHAGQIEYEKATEDSVQGMLNTLDPHSSFFTRKEFQKLNEDQASRFYGIGVSILQHRDGVYVQAIVEGTPAAKAGLRYGDKFLEIDGETENPNQKWTSQIVSGKVRGERGVPVRLKMERAGSKQPLEFTITRDAVPFPSIRNAFMIRPEIGYIGLTGSFQETTEEELTAAIRKLKNQGMKQLVLDLRGNPGGLLPQAIAVTSKFIPPGKTVLTVRGRSRTQSRSENLLSEGTNVEDFPLVVTINGGSASASEIVAGALQDYGRALIVGENSFGKGLVQKVYRLPMGTGLTLTTARYYTPFGRSLQRDYSSGSIYEYYTRHNANGRQTDEAAATPSGSPVTTVGGRVFYGGGGIQPDVKVAPVEFTQLRSRIAEAAFYFTRQLANGQIAGLENYRVERQQFDHVLRPTDYPITDKVLDAFREFLSKDSAHGLKPENINGELEFTKIRLREEIISAAYSSETGQQILLDVDPQILKAIEVLPESKKLAESNKEEIRRIS